jgi:large subunit ribosomal protein MRP49
MQFATHIENGHRGPRKFWRLMYPRLKYHNPAIPMSVRRSADKTFPAILSVFMRGAPPATPPSTTSAFRPVGPNDEMIRWKPDAPRREPAEGERLVEIDMQNRSEAEIWDEFVKVTGAAQVEPTAAEVEEMDRLAALRTVSDADRVRTRVVWEALQREKNILKMAKGEIEMDGPDLKRV